MTNSLSSVHEVTPSTLSCWGRVARGGLSPGEKINQDLGCSPQGGRAGGPVVFLPCHSGEGTNDRVISRCLVCRSQCLAAHIDPVWPEEALGVCWPVCPGSGSRRPTGLREMCAMLLNLHATSGPKGWDPARPAVAQSPLFPTPTQEVGKRAEDEGGSSWGHGGKTAAGLGVPFAPGRA